MDCLEQIECYMCGKLEHIAKPFFKYYQHYMCTACICTACMFQDLLDRIDKLKDEECDLRRHYAIYYTRRQR